MALQKNVLSLAHTLDLWAAQLKILSKVFWSKIAELIKEIPLLGGITSLQVAIPHGTLKTPALLFKQSCTVSYHSPKDLSCSSKHRGRSLPPA